MASVRIPLVLLCVLGCGAAAPPSARAQQPDPPKPTPQSGQGTSPAAPPATPQAPDRAVFKMGEIVVVGTPEGIPGVGGAVLTRDQMWTFDRNSLDQAVNVVPGVVSTLDANGRRNESDIFVRGFGRWQVPLMIDGVRVYLPADNRLDFRRFMTADIAEVQIQKGYASVIDGPGAMGGLINLVTRKPVKAFEVEGSASMGGRTREDAWTAYAMVGTRRAKYYAQGSVGYTVTDSWSLSGGYKPTGNSLQPAGRRLGSDSQDSRFNVKAGFTPNARDEYVVNFTKQNGEKGAPLNVFNNPPVPPNSFWRWPYWDIQNVSVLSRTELGTASYVKSKIYYNTFKNGLDAFDDISYTTQSANGRFRSPYDDHAYGVGLEAGTARVTKHLLKIAAHYRSDFHTEQQENRPTNANPALHTIEPKQEQAQNTWSVAVEDTVQLTSQVDVVGGLSVDQYQIANAQEFNSARGLFEFPKGGSDSFNWQAAVIWRHTASSQIHGSVSDRARFPVIFELYSTRFGTATPNPDLGPERATNVEIGWRTDAVRRLHLDIAVFYSNVRNLVQTVVLPDMTTQTQNVGNGRFYGVDLAADARLADWLRIGANYTAIRRTIRDALQPNLRPTGVPTQKAFLYATWRPIRRLAITPNIDLAGARWSDINPPPDPTFPFVRTGRYALVNLTASYDLGHGVEGVGGFKNATDDNYQLAWGLPQPGRTFFVKTRVAF